MVVLWLLEAVSSRLDAIAGRSEAIASRSEAITRSLEAITGSLEAIASRLEAIAGRLEAIASRFSATEEFIEECFKADLRAFKSVRQVEIRVCPAHRIVWIFGWSSCELSEWKTAFKVCSATLALVVLCSPRCARVGFATGVEGLAVGKWTSSWSLASFGNVHKMYIHPFQVLPRDFSSTHQARTHCLPKAVTRRQPWTNIERLRTNRYGANDLYRTRRGALQDRLGDQAEAYFGHGSRSGCLHRPVPVTEASNAS